MWLSGSRFLKAESQHFIMSAILDQAFSCDHVPGRIIDQLWQAGWRHFGTSFFRYNVSMDNGQVKWITPLRIDVQAFRLRKSQRRVLRRNSDLRHEFSPATLSKEAEAMFQAHKMRFRNHVPDRLVDFLSEDPAEVPCRCLECRVFEGDQLLAISYMDVGEVATSGVYAMFDPAASKRSLGTYTLLLEIDHARTLGCRYYYPGYATREPSAYDYKKQFLGLEVLDWETGQWERYTDDDMKGVSD